MNKFKITSTKSAFLFLLVFFTPAIAQENYKTLNENTSFTNNRSHDVIKLENNSNPGKKPKNIILLIGDGMGVAHVYAGMTANGGKLNMTQMPITGFSTTNSADNYITDSAAGGTALATGQKTYNGAIGVNTDSEKIETILETAEKNGLKTGLVSTSAITHATPASFIAHQKNRSMYEAIAADFLNTDIDVIIGGGKTFFTKRADKRNLIDELKNKGYQTADNVKDIKNTNLPIAVLTAPEHNTTYPSRGELLPDATDLSLKALSTSKKGFFVMIEGSQIDWGAHKNNITNVVNEMLDFDKAVGKALGFAKKDKNTLVIVTADHETGGLAIKSGNIDEKKINAGFVTGKHTPVMVPVFSYGPGSELFTGVFENTDIYSKMMELFGF